MASSVPPASKRPSQHEGTESLAINNTLFRRVLTRLAIKTVGRMYKPDGLCMPISKHKIIKTGRRIHLTEATTMKFIAENTSIPVPKVYCSFVHNDRAYIVMERIQGYEIPTAWRRLSESAQARVLAQLREMLREMRALKPPESTGVESCVGGSLYDSRIKHCKPRFGPFATIQDFHYWLREEVRPSEVKTWFCEDSEWREIEEMARLQDGPWPIPVFTHADLNPFNILVRGERIVGIIDWEFAGWYPDYWEYTSAWHGGIIRTFWQDALNQFLDPQPEALAMEETRQRWWGEI